MLATPLFVMFVYDSVISASSFSMLGESGIGIFIALLGIFVIYRLRAEHLGLIGSRLDRMIGDRIMSQLLYLAPSFTETATTGAQVARIKDFDRVREFISGPTLSIFFELPFVVIGLALIAVLGGPLIFIPIGVIALYGLISFILSIKINHWIRISAMNFSDLQEFMLESIESLRTLKYTNATDRWSEVYREKSAKTSLVGIRLATYDSVSSALSEILMIS